MASPEPEPICEICLDLYARDPREVDEQDEEDEDEEDKEAMYDPPPVAAFIASAEQGCWGCKIMVEIFHAQNLDSETQYAMQLVPQSRVLLVCWDDMVKPKRLWNGCHQIYILSFPNEPCPWPGIAAESPISGDTGSDEAVACVRRWFDDCASNHSCCSDLNSSTELPTRVIRIDGPENVRLYVPTNETAPYVCLSHCWGRTPIIRTILSTLDQYRAAIPWRELSKTFQQAIDFAYRLGFVYIWIDSLCIIQDSTEDWRREAGKMASIYENASLTLCASRSADSYGGCYVTAPPEFCSRKWTFMDRDSKTFQIHTHSHFEHERITWGEQNFSSQTLPLLTRAWTLQERLLSPRIVHFTNIELVWNCSATLACECDRINTAFSQITRKTALQFALWNDKSLEKIHEEWQEIVVSYSNTRLTFGKDKFPALQGLAKKMTPRMGKYLAGLWEECLIYGLTWSAIPLGLGQFLKPDEDLRPEEWRAPTWSWASTKRKLSWPHVSMVEKTNFVPSITILGATTTPKGDDATGELSGGELVIRGRGIKGKVVHAGSTTEVTLDMWKNQSSLFASMSDDDAEEELCFAEGLTVKWDYSIHLPGPDHVPNFSEVTLVKVLAILYNGRESKSDWLILQSNKHCPGVFERIGLVTYTSALVDIHGPARRLANAHHSSPEIQIKIV